MRPLLYALACLAATPALAQEPQPDTTNWRDYYPLAIGNAWHYRQEFDNYPLPPIISYYSEEIVADSVVDGDEYAVVRTCSRSEGGPASCSETVALIRYSNRFTTVVRRLPENGTLITWHDFPCSLDLPFSAPEWVSARCPDGYVEEWQVSGTYGATNCVGDDCLASTEKYFGVLIGGDLFASSLGRLVSGYKTGRYASLLYARINGQEYGMPAVIVATEDDAPVGEPSLSAFPNPLRDAATLRFALDAPQRLTLDVFDVRGRRVRTSALGVQAAGEGTLRFDAAGLPPGAYRLRLAGDSGFAATVGVIRLP